MDHWRLCIRQWFPDLHTRAYFVPPVHFNRVPYDVGVVAGQHVLIPRAASNQPGQGQGQSGWQGRSQSRSPRVQSVTPLRRREAGQDSHIWREVPPVVRPPSVFSSDLRDDLAQQHVLHCLRALADEQEEVMVVISQLNFGNYLNKPCYAAAALNLPRPVDLEPRYQRGDFDLLIVHRQYGLIVGEVKAVGVNAQEMNDLPSKIADRVKKGMEQLEKAKTVLGHMVSDLAHVKLNITVTLILPYITTQHLRQALDADPKLRQDLCRCLDIPTTGSPGPLDLCLCQDQLSDRSKPWEVTEGVMDHLKQWWHHCVRMRWSRWLYGGGGGADLKDDEKGELYVDLLARFCGPATTVGIPCLTSSCPEPRSEGEGAAEVALRMTQLTLFPQQVALINSGERLIFLMGPPGTGKTVVLVLTAINWLQQGRYVTIASTWERSRAISMVIEQQLRHSLGNASTGDCPRVRLSHYSFDKHKDGDQNVDDAVDELTAQARDGQLYVIADEAGPEGSERFPTFCRKLLERVPTLYLWAANVVHAVCPSCLTAVKLTTSLRCPPSITREVAASGPIQKLCSIHNYTPSAAPPPSDGLPVMWLSHRVTAKADAESGHQEGDPEDCQRCGEIIADTLHKLHVGPGRALQYRDVLVLCDNPREQETDKHGKVTTPATGIVRGMRARELPVHVVRSHDHDDALRDLALATTDHVFVTHYDVVSGLERKVVVGLGSKNSEYYVGRPFSMSRSTAQLVWITHVDDDDDDDDDDDNIGERDGGNKDEGKVEKRKPEKTTEKNKQFPKPRPKK